MSTYKIVEIQQLVCGQDRRHVARLCNWLAVRYHLFCTYRCREEMEHTVDKFCDVRSTCITCTWRRPFGFHFASFTVYTVLSNWSHAAETNYTTNQSEVILFHLYGINLLIPNVCNLYIKECWNLTTRLWRCQCQVVCWHFCKLCWEFKPLAVWFQQYCLYRFIHRT